MIGTAQCFAEEFHMNLEINKITSLAEDQLNMVTQWMYQWWGENEGYSYEAVKCYVQNGLQATRLPQTYGMFLDNQLIGVYQFRLDDLFVRPDLYPWLANVYLDVPYRNMGYGKRLMESIRSNAQRSLPYDEVYLFTKHTGLYEKYGWELVSEIDTHLDSGRVQRLYRLSLRK